MTYRRIFLLILGVFVLLAFSYSIAIPLGEAPDEVSHHGYVIELLIRHRLPTAEGEAAGEAFQPPLYYALTALFVAWMPIQEHPVQANPNFSFEAPSPPNLLLHPGLESFPYSGFALAWHTMRLFSILLGALTVWSAFQIARELFPGDFSIAIGTTAFVAFLPAFILTNSVVTSESLMIALGSLTLLQLTRVIQQEPNNQQAIVLGLMLGLAPQAKATGFLLWILTAGVLLARLRNRTTCPEWIRFAAITFILAILLVAPWALYTIAVYGDPFAWSRFNNITPRTAPLDWNEFQIHLTRMFKGFWGKFGGAAHLELPNAAYAAFASLWLLSLLGWGRLIKTRARHFFLPSTQQTLVYFAVLIVMLVSSQVWLLTRMYGTDQTRQLFSGLVPFCLLLVIGILAPWSPRLRLAASVFLAVGLAGVSTAMLVLIIATFAGVS